MLAFTLAGVPVACSVVDCHFTMGQLMEGEATAKMVLSGVPAVITR